MLKTYLKSYLYLFIITISLSIIYTIISYLLNINYNIIGIIISLISLFISTIYLGRNTKQKGYIEGIKYSIIYLLFISIIKLLCKSIFTYKYIFIYLLFILFGILGTMIGINIKKN